MNLRLPITGRAAELAGKDPTLGFQLRLMASDFGFFCRHFSTRSPETGEVFTLSDPFDGQRRAIEAMQVEPKLYVVKARQIGLTTVEMAWDAYVALTRPNAQVAIFFRGITIRDRLRVLLPNDVGNFYLAFDLLTPDQLNRLRQVKIEIVNFHQLQRRERQEFKGVATTTKKILSEDADRFRETPAEMVRRVTRSLGNKRNIVVFSDEAHHCYREKPPDSGGEAEGKLEADEKAEAKQNAEAARVWLTGLEAIKKKIGLRVVYDLSATPFFLRGSGYPEGTLFPWVVSDFSLIDAIESGIVKVPRVPVADDQVTGETPTYRNLWPRIRNDLPKKGRDQTAPQGAPILPKELEGALLSLYGNYEKAFHRWEALDPNDRGTPPVMIIVCNNTTVSKVVCDWAAGWQKELPDGNTVVVPGNLRIFSNEEDGAWATRPNTLLIDSAQIDSGEGMSDDFKSVATAEIEEFKSDYRARFPGRSAEDLTDEDLLREVMNTVGKQGRLGENIKCVVSVAMLTEGWDANTVTHILGVRAFGTQLLCEQVVGVVFEGPLTSRTTMGCSNPNMRRSTACPSPSSRRQEPAPTPSSPSRSTGSVRWKTALTWR